MLSKFSAGRFANGFLWFCLSFLLVLEVHSQTPGRVISWRKTEGGIEGRTALGRFEIRAYSSEIIRVRISRNPVLDNFSYALADPSMPVDKEVSVRESGTKLELATDSLLVTVVIKPALNIVFRNKRGRILNEDESGTGFGTVFTGDKVTVYKKLQESERFVGLGEALGNLDKRGMGLILNNTDNYKYGDPRIPMYISIPFYMGIHHGEVYGIFYNNPYRGFFNFGASNNRFSSVAFDGGDMDYFFMYGNSMARILEHYTFITGRMPLPPKWSLGYHQSRCSYYPQQQVLTIARNFKEKSIPIDCIVLDADYLQDYEPFRINRSRFPDMHGLADSLSRMNIELTASVNPGIKIDSSYDAYWDGLKNDIFLKYPDGSNYQGLMEPSLNHYVDFTSPKGRAWWRDHMKFLEDNGIHGYWNDMNEPAVTGQALPDNLVFDFEGRRSNSLKAKNIYGMQMARASFEAAEKFGRGKRPFVLTRSAFAGVQRYSAVWSGDNQARDEYILGGVLLNSQMGLSGIPFTGPDLGGYIGDGNKELYKRWVEVGVFSPFVRNHREAYAHASEPWAYGEEAEAISKTYIEFRYRLLPYLYSEFYEASQTGMPIARSLCINYPFDPLVFDHTYQYQYLFGEALLVVPVTSEEKVKKIYLPQGNWYDLYTDQRIPGNQELIRELPDWQLPLYVAESSIIPMQKDVLSTRESPGDTLYLHVYNGRAGHEFVWYEDDGSTLLYKQGQYCKRRIEFDPAKKQIRIGAQEGQFKPAYKIIRLMMHGFEEGEEKFTCNERELETGKTNRMVLDPLVHFESIYDPQYLKSLRSQQGGGMQKTMNIPYTAEGLVIQWQ